MRRGFNTWAGYALERLPRAQVLRKGIAGMLCLELRVAFNTWTDVLKAEEDSVLRLLGAFGPDGRMVRGRPKLFMRAGLLQRAAEPGRSGRMQALPRRAVDHRRRRQFVRGRLRLSGGLLRNPNHEQ